MGARNLPRPHLEKDHAMLPRFVVDKKGDIFLNQQTRYVRSCVLVPPTADNPLVIPAATPAGPGLATTFISGPEEACAEINDLMGEHGAADPADVQARLSVVLYDTVHRRNLMNRDILANHVFGSSLTPFFLYETTLLEKLQTLQLNFLNNSLAGASGFRCAFEAREYLDVGPNKAAVTKFLNVNRPRKTQLSPYWFTSPQPITLPAGAVVEVQFGGSDTYDKTIILFNVMCTTLTTGIAGDVVEMAAFEFFAPKTDRPLQNSPVVRTCCTGNANFPYPLPVPLLLEPATLMRVRITNLVTDAPTNVFLTFHGLVYYSAGAGLMREDNVVRLGGPYAQQQYYSLGPEKQGWSGEDAGDVQPIG